MFVDMKRVCQTYLLLRHDRVQDVHKRNNCEYVGGMSVYTTLKDVARLPSGVRVCCVGSVSLIVGYRP